MSGGCWRSRDMLLPEGWPGIAEFLPLAFRKAVSVALFSLTTLSPAPFWYLSCTLRATSCPFAWSPRHLAMARLRRASPSGSMASARSIRWARPVPETRISRSTRSNWIQALDIESDSRYPLRKSTASVHRVSTNPWLATRRPASQRGLRVTAVSASPSRAARRSSWSVRHRCRQTPERRHRERPSEL